MQSEINNAKCADQMVENMKDVDFINMRNTKFPLEWIKAKDQLPEIEGTYVCFMENGHDYLGCFQGFFRITTFSKSFDGTCRFYSRCEDITDDVAYWLLLPKLPNP